MLPSTGRRLAATSASVLRPSHSSLSAASVVADALHGWRPLTHTLTEQPLDGWLCMAVPKRKVTPSRKGIRSQGKHLRFQSVVPKCPGCGKVRLQHGVCPFCLGRGGLPIGQVGVQDTQDGPPPPP